jgi:D-glycero-D-manno-heptose 1,7-bisphosphate phosphatase
VLTGKAAALQGRILPDGYPVHTVVHRDLAAFAEYLVGQDAQSAQTADS